MIQSLKYKLTSRKFIVGLLVLIIGTVLCFTGDHDNGVTLIKIGACGYLGAEGIVDLFCSATAADILKDYEGEDSPKTESNTEERAG